MKNEYGFAMLEVLISLLLILIGVLGLAGLQLMSINNTESARYQSLAVMLASNMASEIQANTAYWYPTAPANIVVNGAAITGGPTWASTCTTAACSAPQMAANDLLNWGTAIANTLPGGNATVACTNVTAPTVCTLTLLWTEKNIALSNPTGSETGQLASGTAQTHQYQTLVAVQ